MYVTAQANKSRYQSNLRPNQMAKTAQKEQVTETEPDVKQSADVSIDKKKVKPIPNKESSLM